MQKSIFEQMGGAYIQVRDYLAQVGSASQLRNFQLAASRRSPMKVL